MFIPISEAVKRNSRSQSNWVNDGDEHFAHSDSIESLTKFRTTGICRVQSLMMKTCILCMNFWN